jgi:heavy metal sensor kinase
MSWKIGGKVYRRTDIKITLWYVFTFLVSALLICGFLYLRLRHQLIKEIDQFLLDETEELRSVFNRNPNEIDFLMRFEYDAESRKYYPFFFRILDQEGKPLYVSKEFREMGYIANEGVTTNTRNVKETREEIHSFESRERFRIITTPIYKDGKLTKIIQLGTHLRFVQKNLSHFRNNILIAFPIILIFGASGGWILARRSLSPIGYIASKAQNITSQNLGERLLERGTGDEMDELIKTINGMIARLESSFKRMAEFTADASHELKTPICAMRGEAEVLLSKGRSAEDYQEGLIHFIEQFEHLNRLINDLILLSKFDSSQVELKMVPLRLDLLLEDLCNIFQVLAEQKNVVFMVSSLPEVAVIGEKMRLQQLFTNLIDNAIKYTLKGSIQVTLEKNQEFVLVKIKDTGIGIPIDEQKNIFKRFYRVDKSRSRETGGVGLGLSIAEWIVRAHHGRIEVNSELNEGSTFTVYLPIQEM